MSFWGHISLAECSEDVVCWAWQNDRKACCLFSGASNRAGPFQTQPRCPQWVPHLYRSQKRQQTMCLWKTPKTCSRSIVHTNVKSKQLTPETFSTSDVKCGTKQKFPSLDTRFCEQLRLRFANNTLEMRLPRSKRKVLRTLYVRNVKGVSCLHSRVAVKMAFAVFPVLRRQVCSACVPPSPLDQRSHWPARSRAS